MKKIIYIIITIMLIFPIKISALDITPVITCDKTVLNIGEQAICKFKVQVSGGKISGISAPFTYENEYATVKVEKESTWEGNANGNSMDYYEYNDYSGNVSIATIIYKVKEDVVINNDITSNLTISVKEVAGENNVANTYNDKISTVKFNILKPVITTSSTTKHTTTTPKKTTTYKKNTTTKNSTTTSQQTTIKEISTTTKDDTTTIKKTTYDDVEKNNNINPIIIASLILFLILIIIAIIIIIKEEQKRKEI